MGDSFGSVGFHLGSDTHVTCHTFPAKGPILVLDAGAWTLLLSPAERDVIGDAAVATARRLADAVTTYLAEVERIHGAGRRAA